MKKKMIRLFLAVCLLSFLSGCALLQPVFETPEVQVTSFTVVPSDSLAPRFEIGLHVINPNSMALKLVGLTYNVELEGHRVLSGATNKLPVIDGYGEGDVVLQADADLVSSLNLLTDFMSRPRDMVTYDLNAVLNVGAFIPGIRVNKTGEISLVNRN